MLERAEDGRERVLQRVLGTRGGAWPGCVLFCGGGPPDSFPRWQQEEEENVLRHGWLRSP